MPLVLTSPLAATANLPTAVTITEGRIERCTIEIPRDGTVANYRITVDWKAGAVVGGVFQVYARGSDDLRGQDAVDVLQTSAPTGPVGRSLERGIWSKLISLGKIPTGTIT